MNAEESGLHLSDHDPFLWGSKTGCPVKSQSHPVAATSSRRKGEESKRRGAKRSCQCLIWMPSMTWQSAADSGA